MHYSQKGIRLQVFVLSTNQLTWLWKNLFQRKLV